MSEEGLSITKKSDLVANFSKRSQELEKRIISSLERAIKKREESYSPNDLIKTTIKTTRGFFDRGTLKKIKKMYDDADWQFSFQEQFIFESDEVQIDISLE
jgi:hypothetical protein